MYRILLLSFSFIFLTRPVPEEKIQFTPIEEVFPVIWKAPVGKVNFRENMLLTPHEIIIGSNGERYMDYTLSDRKGGVYGINRKNGKINRHFGNEVMGDMDVNGLLNYKNKLYYSNDNEEIVCAGLDGKLIWSKPTSGDVEHEPVLLHHSGEDRIVYATETGEVRAIEPEQGKTIWTYYTPDFSGWKPSDNRMIFKVKSFFSNTSSFFTRPINKDLNKDGTEDLIYQSRTGDLYAINGSNGKLLWKNDKFYFDHVALDPDPKHNAVFVATGMARSLMNKDDYRIHVIQIRGNGQHVLLQPLEEKGRSGLNFYINGKEVLINTENHIYTLSKHKISDSANRKMVAKRTYSWETSAHEININHNDMLFGNKPFSYKDQGPCLINLVQHNLDDYDHGFIEIISLKTKQIVDRLQLPGGSEMQPQIEDINQDEVLDLLINCNDNYLYCYQLGKRIK